jgi:hypothetical protein
MRAFNLDVSELSKGKTCPAIFRLKSLPLFWITCGGPLVPSPDIPLSPTPDTHNTLGEDLPPLSQFDYVTNFSAENVFFQGQRQFQDGHRVH